MIDDDLFDEWCASGYAPIFSMCRFGDRLDELALRGDPEAIRTLIKLRPQTVPAGLKKIYRDKALREIAQWLRIRIPGISDRRIALLLEVAISRLSEKPPRGMTGAPFDMLSNAEIEQWKSKISGMLLWLERGKWLRRRQIGSIITRCGQSWSL